MIKQKRISIHTLLATLVLGGFFGITFAGQSCQHLPGRTPGTTPDGGTLVGYKATDASYTQTCEEMKGTLTCTDGSFGNDGNIYKYQSCTPHTWNNCESPILANHLEYKSLYSKNAAVYNQSCSYFSKQFQCIDGQFTGSDVATYSFGICTDKNWKPCIDIRSNSYILNANSISAYTQNTSSATKSCSDLKKQLTCVDGTRSGGIQANLFPSCTDTTTPSTPNNCSLKDINNATITIPNGQTQTLYTAKTSTYPQTCTGIEEKISCTNGNLSKILTTASTTCTDGAAKTCLLWNGIVPHGSKTPGYRQKTATYPKTCADYSTTFSCTNGIIAGGSTDIFPYASCEDKGGLTPGTDLVLSITAPAVVAQYSKPSLQVSIKNMGMDTFDQSNIPAGLLTCQWNIEKGKSLLVYSSRFITGLVINSGTKMSLNIGLSDTFTQAISSGAGAGFGIKNISCTLKSTPDTNLSNNTRSGNIDVVEASRFDIALNRSVSTVKDHLDAPEIIGGAEGVNKFLMSKIMDVVVPLILVVGILIAILGFYKLFFSTDEQSTSDGVKYIAFGAIGIIFIMSAKFITGFVSDSMFNRGVLGFGDIQGFDLAQKIYTDLAFPFLKLAMYLVLGVLFVILISRVITFLFDTDEDAKKKAGTIIGRNVIGMLVIIGSKQIVEAIYGKQDAVVHTITNLGEVGGAILADRNIPLFFKVINWAMGLASLIVLLVIIFQAFALLMKPDDPEQSKKLKNSLLYVFIGIIIIGAGYILSNVLVVN